MTDTKELQEQTSIYPTIETGWIEGEYKWMPTSVTIMPEGWKKIIIGDEGIVTLGFGSAKSQQSISWHTDDEKKGNVTLGTTAFDQGYFVIINSPDTSLMPINIVKTENLWQYDPNNIYSETDAINLNIRISKVESEPQVETKEELEVVTQEETLEEVKEELEAETLEETKEEAKTE